MPSNPFSGIRIILFFLCIWATILSPGNLLSQQSVARQWNECNLSCIRKYQPKPTVHARNLFHASIVMYDAWAVYDDNAAPFFLGQQWGDFFCPFDGVATQSDVQAAQEKTLSYAMYRLLWTRYTSFAPPANLSTIQGYINAQMTSLGYDPGITSTDYSDGDPAKLGNYLAEKMQEFALQDGSNQANNYANQFYTSVNGQFWPHLTGNTYATDPNHWQSMCLSLACSDCCLECIPLPCNSPALTPEWGNVVPFALTENDRTTYTHDGNDYNLYLDPGPPTYLDTLNALGLDESLFKWGYVTNIIWQSFHNNDDGVMIDISPGALGNNLTNPLPQTLEEYQAFYDLFNGGGVDYGHTTNPVSGLPYEQQIVPRKDYTRVLSRYWSDGVLTETMAGHWFVLLNKVIDHPLFEKRWEGQGEILSDLEYDARAYFALSGGMHDAAIASWSAKGAYDVTRPIYAIRWMGSKGQCTDPLLPHFHPGGLPLIPGYIELVQAGDELAGTENENVDKIKVYSWRGPVIATELDGSGWLLAENWWPYQSATFVTPPYQGYYSEHSACARTAAAILTQMTGSEFFPGGMAEFVAPADNYLVADSGPSIDVALQWATYYDAADQCALARIYGGLHTPQEDIAGRMAGAIIGEQSYNYAMSILGSDIPHVTSITFSDELISDIDAGDMLEITVAFSEQMNTTINPDFYFYGDDAGQSLNNVTAGSWLPDGMHYVLPLYILDANETLDHVVFQVLHAEDMDGNENVPAVSDAIAIDTENPFVLEMALDPNDTLITSLLHQEIYFITAIFSEKMDAYIGPDFEFNPTNAAAIWLDVGLPYWAYDSLNYKRCYNWGNVAVEIPAVYVTASGGRDKAGNLQIVYTSPALFEVDTKSPQVSSTTINTTLINDDFVGNQFIMEFEFDEPMDLNSGMEMEIQMYNLENPNLTFSIDNENSGWFDGSYRVVYNTSDANIESEILGFSYSGGMDLHGNLVSGSIENTPFFIDTRNPQVVSLTANTYTVTTMNSGVNGFSMEANFDEPMNFDYVPEFTFPVENPNTLYLNTGSSGWQADSSYVVNYDVDFNLATLENIDISLSENARDMAGNICIASDFPDFFSIQTEDAIGESALLQAILIYPNPIERGNSLTIEGKMLPATCEIEIYNATGQMIKGTGPINLMSKRMSLNTGTMAAGFYQIRVKSGAKTASFKICVIED